MAGLEEVPGAVRPGGTSPANPCSNAIEPSAELAPISSGAAVAAKSRPIDGSSRWNVLDALWLHRQEAERRAVAGLAPEPVTTGVNNADIGDIAVIQDEGDLILAPNQFDLRSLRRSVHAATLRTATTRAGSTRNFRQTLGRAADARRR